MRYFTGEISGKKLSSFNPSTLENLEKYEERLSVIQDIIINDKDANAFFTGYIENYYKSSPSLNEGLSDEDAVCNMLSLFATYLLSSKDIDSERKVEYKFWKSIRDFKKSEEYKRTVNESQLSNGNDDDNRVEVIDMFADKNNRNSKKAKDIVLTSKDVKNNSHIGELQVAVKYIKSEVGEKNIKKHIEKMLNVVKDEKQLALLKRVLYNYKSYMRKYASSMKDDQLLIKKATDVVVNFNNTLDESGFPVDWSNADISNRKLFVELLQCLSQREMMSDKDVPVIAYDLYTFLNSKQAGLSERELEIVECFGIGLEQKKIADELGITKSSLQSYVNRIHAKVIKSGYTIE